MISNHVKDAADHIERVSTTVFAKIAKHSLNALQVALGALGLIFMIKKVVDRFFQMFDSRREYESRTSRAEVNAFLYRSEKKHAECSLVNDIRGITDAQKETMFDIMGLLEQFPVSEDDIDTARPAVDAMLMRLCNDDVQMCFQVLRGDLGEVLAESGVMNRNLAHKIAGLARSGPLTDLAISTNVDEAGALQSMGYEVRSQYDKVFHTIRIQNSLEHQLRYSRQDHLKRAIDFGHVDCVRNIQ